MEEDIETNSIYSEDKEAFEKTRLENLRKERLAAIQKAKENIPSWIERGKALIFPERQADWEKCVRTHANSIYNGEDLDAALKVMEVLENGATIEEAKQVLKEQDFEPAVLQILFLFSSRGPELFESAAYWKLSDKDKEIIEAKKQENAWLAQINDFRNKGHKHNN